MTKSLFKETKDNRDSQPVNAVLAQAILPSFKAIPLPQ